MDSLENQMQPPNQVDRVRKLFLFTEIGILEVLFIVAILFLTFSVLNYLNIFRISSSIGFLSFLPHLPYNNQTVNNSEPTPTIGPARDLINQFLQETITKDTLTTFNKLNIQYVNSNPTEENFLDSNGQIVLQGKLYKAPTTYNDYAIFLTPLTKAEQSSPLSSEVADTLTKKYFLTPNLNTPWICNSTERIPYCEEFLNSGQGGIGFGIIQQQQTAALFYCKINKLVVTSSATSSKCMAVLFP